MATNPRISYDGRRFRRPEEVTDGGAPTAVYHQQGDLVWAEVAGGEVRRGSLVGRCAEDGTLAFSYSMVLQGGEVISGRSVSRPEILADGRIRLHEEWERFAPRASAGTSAIEEATC
ncbi:hypothetical protein ACGFIK_24435 [Micromonospora sp. NPDC048871]|uniref:hypothetical protein n=1 Tax=unclassified Micromonospora TaxID=2617518 RepID=UPI002E13B2FD|nr:hypothetical protein OIE53_07450 [Micromonospora sp. NBC_01739]